MNKNEQRRTLQSTWKIAVAIAACVLLFLSILAFIIPLIFAITPAFRTSGKISGNILYITAFTVAQALCSLTIALAIGVCGAYFVANRNFKGKRFLISSSVIPTSLPALIMALGYIQVFGLNGLYNKILCNVFSLDEGPIKFLYSLWGIVLAQGFYNVPLVIQAVGRTWQHLGKDEEYSAYLLGASRKKVFFTITLWKLLPSIGGVAIPVFLYCFFSFMIILMFGSPGIATLETEIFHAGRSVLNFKSAAILSLIETSIAFLVLFIYSQIEKKSEKVSGISFYKDFTEQKKLSKKDIIPFGILIILLLGFFYIPLLSIIKGAWNGWKKLFSYRSFFPSLITTVKTGSCTALICTVTAFTYSVLIRKHHGTKKERILKNLALLPMAVSSVVLGIGFIRCISTGKFVHLVFAQSALLWPFAFKQLNAGVISIPEETLNAANILSSKLDTIFKVMIPQSKETIFSTLALTFSLSAGEAALPLVLSIPNYTSLSLLIYRLSSSYRFSEACAVAITQALLCLVISLILQEKKTCHTWK